HEAAHKNAHPAELPPEEGARNVGRSIRSPSMDLDRLSAADGKSGPVPRLVDGLQAGGCIRHADLEGISFPLRWIMHGLIRREGDILGIRKGIKHAKIVFIRRRGR